MLWLEQLQWYLFLWHPTMLPWYYLSLRIYFVCQEKSHVELFILHVFISTTFKLANTTLNKFTDGSEKIWDVLDVRCLEVLMFRMWDVGYVDVWDIGCLGCVIFGMCDVRDEGYLVCGMFGMQNIWDVRCLGRWMFEIWDVWIFAMLDVWNWDMGCSRCWMFGMWNVQDVGYSKCGKIPTSRATHIPNIPHVGCGILRMVDVWDEECWVCRILRMLDV